MLSYAETYNTRPEAPASKAAPKPIPNKKGFKRQSRAKRTITKREMKYGDDKHTPDEANKRKEMSKEKHVKT